MELPQSGQERTSSRYFAVAASPLASTVQVKINVFQVFCTLATTEQGKINVFQVFSTSATGGQEKINVFQVFCTLVDRGVVMLNYTAAGGGVC